MSEPLPDGSGDVRVVGVDGAMFADPVVFVRGCSSGIDEAQQWAGFFLKDLSDSARVDEVMVDVPEPPLSDYSGMSLWARDMFGLVSTVADCALSREDGARPWSRWA